jgi:hypothetical protein
MALRIGRGRRFGRMRREEAKRGTKRAHLEEGPAGAPGGNPTPAPLSRLPHPLAALFIRGKSRAYYARATMERRRPSCLPRADEPRLAPLLTNEPFRIFGSATDEALQLAASFPRPGSLCVNNNIYLS